MQRESEKIIFRVKCAYLRGKPSVFLGGQMEAELNLEAKQNSRGQVICQEARFLKFGPQEAKVVTLPPKFSKKGYILIARTSGKAPTSPPFDSEIKSFKHPYALLFCVAIVFKHIFHNLHGYYY